MKILFDTSLIVAAFVDTHPTHERAFPWIKRSKAKEFELVVAGHSLAELYAVLSTLPIKPRIPPSVAWRLIHENIDIESTAKIISLTPAEHISTIRRMSDLGMVGGAVYDALIAKVAQKSSVERLITLNTEHFRRVWPEGKKIIFLP